MACQAQYHNIAPVVGLPLPLFMQNIQSQDMMPPIAGWEQCERKLADLVETLATSAKENGIDCVDFYHIFLGTKGEVLGKYFLQDGLHPNKLGHKLMAEKMVELLRKVFYFS